MPEDLPQRCVAALHRILEESDSQVCFLVRRTVARRPRYRLLFTCERGFNSGQAGAEQRDISAATFAAWESDLQALNPIYIDDTASARGDSELAFLREYGYRSVLLLPLVCRGYASGFLGLATLDRTHDWPETVRNVVQQAAEVLANALDRAEVDANHAELLRRRRTSERKALEAQEQEWRFLARELHDEIGPYLTAIKTEATLIDVKADNTEIGNHAGAIRDQADHIYQAVHGLIRRLRSTVLDELGLEGAVRSCVAESALMKMPVQCDVDIQGELDDIDDTVASSVLRLLQECLNNVARHAQASQVKVVLLRDRSAIADRRGRYRQGERGTTSAPLQQDSVVLRVSDDGVGMDLKQKQPGMGLRGMRERVEALGGHLDVNSTPGRGMQINVSIVLSVTESK